VQTQFLYWFGKVRCLRPVPKKSVWKFHYLTNPLHFLKHTRTTLPLCSDALQKETHNLLALFFRSKKKKKKWSLLKETDVIMKPSIPYWLIQVFGQEIFEDKRFLFERIMSFVNSENSEENSCPSHLLKYLWWSFKNPMKSCDCW